MDFDGIDKNGRVGCNIYLGFILCVYMGGGEFLRRGVGRMCCVRVRV